jgi:type IV secretion system protein VirB3
MAGNGRLQADPLFQGLARPAMIAGVSFMYFILNGSLCLILFIQTSSFLVLLFMGPLIHLVGYFICMKEPRAIELLMLRAGKGMKCVNRTFHGHTNSYDAF